MILWLFYPSCWFLTFWWIFPLCTLCFICLVFVIVDGREDDYVYVSEALLAGLAAGTMEALVCTPFELLKVRAQVASASHLPASTPLPKQLHNAAPSFSKLFHAYSPNPTAWDRTLSLLSVLPGKQPDLAAFKEYPWMMTGSGRPPFAYEVRGLSNITSLEGLGVLLRGLRAGIVRDSVFGGFFFSTWQFLHIAMLNWKAIQMEDQPRFLFLDPFFSSRFLWWVNVFFLFAFKREGWGWHLITLYVIMDPEGYSEVWTFNQKSCENYISCILHKISFGQAFSRTKLSGYYYEHNLPFTHPEWFHKLVYVLCVSYPRNCRSVVDIGPVSPLGAGVAAGFSGAFAAAASHCFDTAKTRSQAVVVPKVRSCLSFLSLE